MRAYRWLAILIVMIGVACSRGNVAGIYVSDRARMPKDQLSFAADGTFTLEEDGCTVSGTYKAAGQQITLTTNTGQSLSGTVVGSVFTDQTGQRWTKR
jgi:hypothetical protein